MDEDECMGEDEIDQKSPTAEDYYDFNELCEVDENAVSGVASSDDSDSERSDISVTFNYAPPEFNADINIPGKPLSSVLPRKYLNIDVTSIIPDFRENSVLRFNRIFGIGKPSNKPDIWKAVRKKNELEKNLRKEKPSSGSTGTELEVESDEEIKFLLDRRCTQSVSSSSDDVDNKHLNNTWRFGAAKLWYDMLSLPEDIETYDYGFKVKESNSNPNTDSEDNIPDNAFLMVNQLNWEDDVIWDGDEVKDDVLKDLYSTKKPTGWIPVGSERTVEAFNEHVKIVSNSDHKLPKYKNFDKRNVHSVTEPKSFQSMFPEENVKLIHDRWEDDVIWDSEAMVRISYPKTVEIDDENIIVDIPDDDESVPEEPSEVTKDRKDRKYRPPLKQKDDAEDEDSDMPTTKVDFYNISNDEYYNAKLTQDAALKLGSGGCLLQHSIPAVELIPAYFPTHMGPQRLRHFHRRPLKQYSHGALSRVDFHGVHSLVKHIKHKRKQRLKELEESGGGEMFFMRTPEDLSAKDGELVFFEYSEEHPPLMSQIGMASKIRNYYRRKPGKDTILTEYKFGETAYAHTSPFLGALQPGESIQTFENNMFRAPVYEHTLTDTDFLIIRTRHKYYIREVEFIFTVGQELPLMEVPAPKSEKANSFIKDFLMIFIYRLFWKSEDIPRKIRMDDIRKAFPTHREFSIRKRLNLCADFQRTGFDSKFWVLKSNFRLPSEDEIRQMVSPEQCCAYYSMLAAEQRLKDAGYGDKYLLMADENNDDFQNKIDDEVKAAPWNTTQAFISAIRGKCVLELLGEADPTGCGEGFAYVKVPSKPQWLKEEFSIQNQAKRLVRGTDADLRRLSLPNAKKLLRTFKVPDHEIKKMTRWQIIDVVRTLSTEQARLGEEGITKYARGNIYSQAAHQRKYKEECQRLFDLQNRVLSSNEVLSSDEESSSDEDSDLEEMGKHIENILANKKSAKDFTHESEEAERKELQKMMSSESPLEDAQKNKAEKPEGQGDGKIMKIYRTYQNPDGTKFVRVETVRRPEIIELYTKIRETKDNEFIRNYCLDEAQKEAIRREKRRIQDQLRRLKKHELKEKSENSLKEPARKKMKIEQTNMNKVKCGACGAAGHMRTNKACPLYQSSPSLPPIQVAMTEEQEEAEEKACLDDQNAIKLDETKLIVSKSFLKHTDEVRRKSLVLKIPKDAVYAGKKKRSYDITTSDYLSAPKYVNRKRIDPVVSISIIFENLLNELKALDHTQPFWFPVNNKIAPNYHLIIKKPMDLHTMREKIRKQEYKSREDFLTDLTQILENCKLYNGSHSFLSITAQTMLDHCIKCFSEKEEKLMQLEKSINPLLDDDQVAFSFMLETIVNDNLKTVSESWPFHKPVDKRIAKGYYDIVKTPMDLDSIARNCKANKYKTRAEFLADVELVYKNSVSFNGPNSQFTKIALQIVDACRVSLEMYEDQLVKYESGIRGAASNGSSVHQTSSPQRTKDEENYHVDIGEASQGDGISCNKSANDSFIDVESFDVSPENYAQGSVNDRSDCDTDDAYKLHETNSTYSFSPVDSNNESREPPSPTNSSRSQSLFPVNGVHNRDIVNTTLCEDQPFSQSTCDNICDDLMLSESDSDDAAAVDDELKF